MNIINSYREAMMERQIIEEARCERRSRVKGLKIKVVVDKMRKHEGKGEAEEGKEMRKR